MADAVAIDKTSARIRAMFGRVAPRYDLLNRLLSASLDRRWRRLLTARLRLAEDARVLDLCCGTGDQAQSLRGARRRIVAADFCLPMLARTGAKFRQGAGRAPTAFAADALALPYADRSFDAATVSFGLRNVADLDRALGELARVVRPGGRLGVLEFTIPVGQPLRGLYLFYFNRLLPAIGALVSADGDAYRYLPDSVVRFPQRAAFVAGMATAGFSDGAFEELSGGILCLYRGVRSA